MRQLLFAAFVALISSPFVGCASSSCLTSGSSAGCATGSMTAAHAPSCGASLGSGLGGLPGLPSFPQVAPQQCNSGCNEALQQGYLRGVSFGGAVSCGMKQVLAIPLAAATFVGGTAEALLGGIGSLGSCQLAQTTSSVSANCDSYADSACTCDSCINGTAVDIQTPLQVIPTFPSMQQSVQGCVPCDTGSFNQNTFTPGPVYNTTPNYSPVPMQQIPMTPSPSFQQVPSVQGSLPMAPPSTSAERANPARCSCRCSADIVPAARSV